MVAIGPSLVYSLTGMSGMCEPNKCAFSCPSLANKNSCATHVKSNGERTQAVTCTVSINTVVLNLSFRLCSAAIKFITHISLDTRLNDLSFLVTSIRGLADDNILKSSCHRFDLPLLKTLISCHRICATFADFYFRNSHCHHPDKTDASIKAVLFTPRVPLSSPFQQTAFNFNYGPCQITSRVKVTLSFPSMYTHISLFPSAEVIRFLLLNFLFLFSTTRA